MTTLGLTLGLLAEQPGLTSARALDVDVAQLFSDEAADEKSMSPFVVHPAGNATDNPHPGACVLSSSVQV